MQLIVGTVINKTEHELTVSQIEIPVSQADTFTEKPIATIQAKQTIALDTIIDFKAIPERSGGIAALFIRSRQNPEQELVLEASYGMRSYFDYKNPDANAAPINDPEHMTLFIRLTPQNRKTNMAYECQELRIGMIKTQTNSSVILNLTVHGLHFEQSSIHAFVEYT